MKNATTVCRNCGEIIDFGDAKTYTVHIIKKNDAMTFKAWECSICKHLYMTEKQAAIAGQNLLLLGYDEGSIGKPNHTAAKVQPEGEVEKA